MMIERLTMEQLIESQWNSMYMTSLPRQRFFVPNDKFWKRLTELGSYFDVIVDCGTGNGELPKEAEEYGIRMAGLDVVRRDDNAPTEVQIIPAHRMPFDNRIWALVCRPSHGGWVEALQMQTLEAGSGFIYVSKAYNINDDVHLDCNLPDDLIRGVGEEDESMLVWLPK